LIDTDSGPKPFAEVMDPWQRADFEALDSGWQRAVVGAKAKAKYQRGWLERPRGHAKSADLGVMAAWALFASRRRLSGIAGAGDQDQARLLRDAIGKLLFLNPWLANILTVEAYRVKNERTGSILEIISSDAPTAYGLTPDFLICDEVTHWRKRDLWDALLSSAAKRSTCMLVCIQNAGLEDDWQWTTREAIRKDSGWYFSRLDGPVASWISPELLAEQERLLPPIAYRRLWLNEWTSGGSDCLTQETIDAAFLEHLRPLTCAIDPYSFVAGLDLAVSRDASALVILGVNRTRNDHGRIVLAHTRVWRPSKGAKVNLQDVEDCIVDLHNRFQLKALNYDPFAAQQMAGRIGAVGAGVQAKTLMKYFQTGKVPMVEVPQTGQNLQKQATALLEGFNDRRVSCYPEPDLRRDLMRLRIEERSYGYRLVSPHVANATAGMGTAHGDLASAFSLAMLAAAELAGKKIPAKVGSMTSSRGQTLEEHRAKVEQRIANRAAYRARSYQEEMQALAAMPDYSNHVPDGWFEMLRAAGRY
jgi:hypothetical protein